MRRKLLLMSNRKLHSELSIDTKMMTMDWMTLNFVFFA